MTPEDIKNMRALAKTVIPSDSIHERRLAEAIDRCLDEIEQPCSSADHTLAMNVLEFLLPRLPHRGVDGRAYANHLDGIQEAILRLVQLANLITNETATPIPMILHCPVTGCGVRHIDEGELATRPHKTHTCQKCGFEWKPCAVATVGVQFLPGSKNEK